MDIIARSNQFRTPLNPDTLKQGAELYNRIIAGDEEAAQQLQSLAEASERGEWPVIVEEAPKPGPVHRLLGRLGLIK